MAYVSIPADLTRIKDKVLFQLTRRQLICFGCGIAAGVPLYFVTKSTLGSSAASMCMILVMLPFFFLAVYEKHGRPLEKILHDMYRVFIKKPKLRPYQTDNLYAVLQRQAALDKEVSDIVRRYRKKERT